MAEDVQDTTEQEAQEVKFDPKDNRYVFVVILVDLAENIRDVTGVVHLAAASQEQAAGKAAYLFQKQGLIIPEGKYSFQIAVVGVLPDTGPRILRPTARVPHMNQIIGAR